MVDVFRICLKNRPILILALKIIIIFDSEICCAIGVPSS